MAKVYKETNLEQMTQVKQRTQVAKGKNLKPRTQVAKGTNLKPRTQVAKGTNLKTRTQVEKVKNLETMKKFYKLNKVQNPDDKNLLSNNKYMIFFLSGGTLITCIIIITKILSKTEEEKPSETIEEENPEDIEEKIKKDNGKITKHNERINKKLEALFKKLKLDFKYKKRKFIEIKKNINGDYNNTFCVEEYLEKDFEQAFNDVSMKNKNLNKNAEDFKTDLENVWREKNIWLCIISGTKCCIAYPNENNEKIKKLDRLDKYLSHSACSINYDEKKQSLYLNYSENKIFKIDNLIQFCTNNNFNTNEFKIYQEHKDKDDYTRYNLANEFNIHLLNDKNKHLFPKDDLNNQRRNKLVIGNGETVEGDFFVNVNCDNLK